MIKNNLVVLLNECFEKEGNCSYLHLVDGSELLIKELPNFFDAFLRVNQRTVMESESEEINEVVCIPYSSVMYITLTNFDNLEIIAKQYEKQYEEQYQPLADVTLDDFKEDTNDE